MKVMSNVSLRLDVSLSTVSPFMSVMSVESVLMVDLMPSFEMYPAFTNASGSAVLMSVGTVVPEGADQKYPPATPFTTDTFFLLFVDMGCLLTVGHGEFGDDLPSVLTGVEVVVPVCRVDVGSECGVEAFRDGEDRIPHGMGHVACRLVGLRPAVDDHLRVFDHQVVMAATAALHRRVGCGNVLRWYLVVGGDACGYEGRTHDLLGVHVRPSQMRWPWSWCRGMTGPPLPRSCRP